MEEKFYSLTTVIPALSTPVAVWCDEHLTAVVCVRVVNIQLQFLPFIGFNEGEQIITLFKEERHTSDQPVATSKSTLLLIQSRYLIHGGVSSYNVVSMRS